LAVAPTSDLAGRLAARTLELVDVPSVSRGEAELHRHVARVLDRPGLELSFANDDCLLYSTGRRVGTPLVLLAGHLDTVPPQDNIPGRLDGDEVIGLGASDMKGGLAVMIELGLWFADERPSLDVDVALVFFSREELALSESSLPGLFAASPLPDEADLVVVMEPTDNTIQAGCLGNINARLAFTGESAHSARPWLGVNAIAKAVEGLAPIVRVEPLEVDAGGLTFVEVLSVTGIEGGIAQNVIPDRTTCLLNFRYAPGRTPEEAEERLRELVGEAGELEIQSNAPSARVAVGSPLVERLRRAGDFAVQPKQAWTPVAEFAMRGLDAINLGPGATRYAHRRDERVVAGELARTHEALQRFVTGAG
jgi:succinyl-diaminopimelate desuccinylase